MAGLIRAHSLRMSLLDSQTAGGLCLLRLNHPPVNTLTLELLEELLQAIRAAQGDGAVEKIVITGTAEHFSAGADVGLFRELREAGAARELCRRFQEAFQELEASVKPVAAAVAGKMMGGALELAMACHARVCARGTQFSMPEVNLGINPGAGGTQRLPRLVGAGPALQMLLTGKPVGAEEALALGLVDGIAGGSGLVEEAARCLEGTGGRRRTSERRDKIEDAGANRAALAQAEQRIAGTRPELVAPGIILEAVRTGLERSFDEGQLAERELFARCMESLGTRNKIHVFFATKDTAKTPDLGGAEARPVNRVAVIGMGSMGAGIAQAVLQAGLPVVVTDESAASLERGQERIRESLRKRAAQGRLSGAELEATLGRLTATKDLGEIAAAGLVIEAVFEDVKVKQSVLGAVDRLAGEGTLLASNTSTISLDVLAAGLERPGRFVGLHFFNPAQRMPLVEVIRRDGTSAEAVATALRFAKSLRKTPVLVRNREGFIVNRIFVPYLAEAFRLLEEGAAPEAIDAAMVEFGFPMGPLTLIDMAGLDILVHTAGLLEQAFPRHGAVPQVAAAMVSRGFLGQKRGAGVYLYGEGQHQGRPHAATQEIVREAQRRSGKGGRAVSREEISQRLVFRMVAEAFCVLEEGIAQRESDVDAAMVLGTGFPDFRGGVLKYARDCGLRKVWNELEILANRCGERFAPCELLNELKERNGSN